jgi:hypothetical protein
VGSSLKYWNSCLANTKPWIQNTVPRKKKKILKKSLFTRENQQTKVPQENQRQNWQEKSLPFNNDLKFK